jgi:hypothetical protein
MMTPEATLRHDPEFLTYLREHGGPRAEELFQTVFDPQDEGFLKYIRKKYADEPFSRALVTHLRNLDTACAASILHRSGSTDIGVSPEEYAEMSRDLALPEAMFEGEMVTTMRMRNLLTLIDMVGPSALDRGLHTVPVVMLPSRELNAFSVRAPSGRAVVVLDSWMTLFFPLVVTSIYAMSGYADYKGDLKGWVHQPGEHATTVIALATDLLDATVNAVTWVPALRDIPGMVEWTSNITECCEDFVLLHEFGHVYDLHYSMGGREGDCAPGKGEAAIARKLFEDITTIGVTSKQEMYADAFAALAFSGKSVRKRSPLTPVERASAIAIFFQFLALVEFLQGNKPDPSGHPPAHIRWELIDSTLRRGIKDDSVMRGLLSPFKGIFQMAEEFLKERAESQPGVGLGAK